MQLIANLSLMFTEYPMLERFSKAAAAGFDGVEIQFPYEWELDQLIAESKASGMPVSLINVPAGDLMQGGEGLACVPGREAHFRQAVADCLEYARALNVACVNVLPGRVFDAAETETYMATLVANLRYAAEAFAEYGIRCCFEAINTRDMPGFIIHSSNGQQAVMAQVKSDNLFMQYDIYHMQMMGEIVSETLSANAASIGHIQFADVPGRGQPGSGNIEFGSLLELVKSSAYQGVLAAEYKPAPATARSLDWLPEFRQRLS